MLNACIWSVWVCVCKYVCVGMCACVCVCMRGVCVFMTRASVCMACLRMYACQTWLCMPAIPVRLCNNMTGLCVWIHLLCVWIQLLCVWIQLLCVWMKDMPSWWPLKLYDITKDTWQTHLYYKFWSHILWYDSVIWQCCMTVLKESVVWHYSCMNLLYDSAV